MPALRSSSRSASPSGSVATVVGGSLNASTVATVKTMAARPRAHWAPPRPRRIPPGTTATTTASADSTVSLELASTSSVSLRTVPGTTALLEIVYTLASTSMPKASG